MTLDKGIATAQLVERIVEAGHFVVVRMGDYDISGQDTELVPLVFVAPKAYYVKSAKMVSLLALATDEANYVSITLRNITQTEDLAATPKSTKTTGGEAFVANTAWDITVDQNNTLAAGDVLQLSLNPASASVANDLTDIVLALEITFDEADAL